MSSDATGLPPAGWYDDPQDPNSLRYWDGGQWLADTQPRIVPPTPEPVAVPEPAAQAHAPGPVGSPELLAAVESVQADQRSTSESQAPTAWAQQAEQSWAPEPTPAERTPEPVSWAPSSPAAPAADSWTAQPAASSEPAVSWAPEVTPAAAVPAWLAQQAEDAAAELDPGAAESGAAGGATVEVMSASGAPVDAAAQTAGDASVDEQSEGASESAGASQTSDPDLVTVVTTSEVSGAHVSAVHGTAVGIAVCRPAGLSGDDEAVAATLVGLSRSALATLRSEAAELGGNAVVDSRYERTSLPDLIEVTIYGTVVTLDQG